ncbi:DUF4397 domain-containing protein [Halobium salinum]|uniref:DUF4397 domain-containing protein n=1 Tax=Halobium salinum TaxID=1364940 RepID=A0ABD5PCR4_9EURY|nr:DUF4397 domain-containing protein [Halobium salinum]
MNTGVRLHSRTPPTERRVLDRRGAAKLRVTHLATGVDDLRVTLTPTKTDYDADAPSTSPIPSFRLPAGTVTGELGFRFDAEGVPTNVVDPLVVPTGTYDVTVADDGSGRRLARRSLRLGAVPYTLVVFGAAADADLRVRLLRDKLGVLHPDTARVRVVNVAPEAPTLDAWLADGADLATGLGYGAAAGHRDCRPGTHELVLSTPRGVGDDPTRRTLRVALAADSTTTVFVAGSVAREGVERNRTDGGRDGRAAVGTAETALTPVVAVSDTYAPPGR